MRRGRWQMLKVARPSRSYTGTAGVAPAAGVLNRDGLCDALPACHAHETTGTVVRPVHEPEARCMAALSFRFALPAAAVHPLPLWKAAGECTRQESNLYLRLRRPLLYPFNYGCVACRFGSLHACHGLPAWASGFMRSKKAPVSRGANRRFSFRQRTA